MENKQLLQTLENLHQQLQSASSVDTATRETLQKLAADIGRLSEARSTDADATEAGSPGPSVPLAEELHEQLLKFEVDHPQLTHAINQVAAALANLGI